MERKLFHKPPQAKELARTAEKPRRDRSAPVNPHAFAILEAARKRGFKKIDFASEAIVAYGKEKLGNAIPASPEDVLEARLDYLERIVSRMAWYEMCESAPQKAKKLRRHVAKTGHSPFARDFGALNELREAKGKGAAKDTDWITAAFAEKFRFPLPEEE